MEAKQDNQEDNGIGEAFVSHHAARRRPGFLVALTLAGVIAATAIGLAVWQAVQYQHRKTLRSPAKQAQSFDKVSTVAQKQDDLWRYDQEITSLEDYLATQPLDQYRDKARMSLAKAYAGNKQYDQAISNYKQLESNPLYQLDAWRGLGKAYLAKGDRVKAKEYFQKVVDLVKTKTDPESVFRLTADEAQLNSLNGS